MPATWSNSGKASETTSTGALSISTRSDISQSSASTVDIRADPSISDGFGGIDPPGSTRRFEPNGSISLSASSISQVPEMTSLSPGASGAPMRMPACGLRRSASTRMTCLPERA